MKRNKTKKTPDFIITSDWHLREDQPICRIDDFQSELWRKVAYIMSFNIPVLHSGDLYHHWKPSPYLISKTLKYLSNFYTIYGNHDLPQHSYELREKCGLYTLEKAGALEVLPGGHWNEEVTGPSLTLNNGRQILLLHTGVYKGKSPYPGCTDIKANKMLKKYSEYDLIITGHNHKPFTHELNGRLLVNPGGISRQDANEADYKPRIYFYYADTNTIEKHYIPINDTKITQVISREHLEEKKERDERINVFISKLNTNLEASLSFEDNLERFLKINKISKEVTNIINQTLD